MRIDKQAVKKLGKTRIASIEYYVKLLSFTPSDTFVHAFHDTAWVGKGETRKEWMFKIDLFQNGRISADCGASVRITQLVGEAPPQTMDRFVEAVKRLVTERLRSIDE